MKVQNIKILMALPLILGALSTHSAMAEEIAQQVITQPSPWTAEHKLNRGITNALTGWMELGNQTQVNQDQNLFEAMTTGLARGIGWTIARTGTGIYETVTAPYAIPEKFEPLTQPEYIFKLPPAKQRSVDRVIDDMVVTEGSNILPRNRKEFSE